MSEGAEGEKRLDERQGVFDEPIKPKYPGTQSPQVPSVDQQSIRFNETQSGAPEQFTRFNIVVAKARAFFNSPGSLFIREELTPFNKNSPKSSTDISISSTKTWDTVWEEECNWSNTITTQVRLGTDRFKFDLWGPAGRKVEADDNCDFDRNMTAPDEEGEEEERYPNS
jgi:hypothetical protein